MNPWVRIIAIYGLEFAIELTELLNKKVDPTKEDFDSLKTKYASKKAADYLSSGLS